MKEFVDDFRKIAPDKYYTFGSNYYLGYQGIKEGIDYFTLTGGIRGRGCPVDTSAAGRSADRAGRRERPFRTNVRSGFGYTKPMLAILTHFTAAYSHGFSVTHKHHSFLPLT